MRNCYVQDGEHKLLSRKEFKEIVFQRQGGICCKPECSETAVDAHHILDRKLWVAGGEKGGYFALNGAGMCSEHHLKAESGEYTCEQIRRDCGISTVLIPEQLPDDPEFIYDKWGELI